MRIAFLSPWDMDDPLAWSGVVHRMCEALGTRADVLKVGSGDIRPAVADRIACRVAGGLAKRGYLVGHAVATGVKRAQIVRRRIREVSPDVVLAVAASQEVAFLRIPQPIVLVSDATFRSIRGYYPGFERLLPPSSWQGEVQEARSLRRADWCAVATRWAQRSLIRDYGISPDQSSVIPFGPALEPTGPFVPRSPVGEPLRLLTVASDWARKGGDLSVSVFQQLKRRGVKASLTVVGDAPALPAGVVACGRVDRVEMGALYERHDVLLELARANCAGVTLTDAAAYGMPVVATNTGGVATIVRDGKTGILVDPLADVVASASEAVGRLVSTETYAAMSTQARRRHEQCLNWDVWADDVLRVCRDVAR